jgi:hypothetical protein
VFSCKSVSHVGHAQTDPHVANCRHSDALNGIIASHVDVCLLCQVQALGPEQAKLTAAQIIGQGHEQGAARQVPVPGACQPMTRDGRHESSHCDKSVDCSCTSDLTNSFKPCMLRTTTTGKTAQALACSCINSCMLWSPATTASPPKPVALAVATMSPAATSPGPKAMALRSAVRTPDSALEPKSVAPLLSSCCRSQRRLCQE